MVSLPLTGGCVCGGVRYEIDRPLIEAEYCHCKRCQRRTGTAASATALAEPGSLRVVEGEELVRAWDPGDGWPDLFCSECGSRLFCRNPADPEQYGVQMGSFDEDPGVAFGYRQFVDYAASWEPIPDDGLARYGERRPA